jgi:multiple sugar transport system substrate-binding protein
VCSNIHPGALYDYTRAHGLVALDRLPGFDSIASLRAVPDLLETFRSPDGHYYQLPWKTNPILMFYNKRLLSEAGVLSVPRTYGEYLAAGKKVSRDHDGDGQIDTWMGERDIRPIWWQRLFDFYPFYVAASGGQTLFRNGAVSLDERAASDVFEFFRACYDLLLFPRTFFQGGDPFLLEKKATHFSGPWEVATIKKFAPAMEYGVAPLPVPDTGAGTAYTYGDFKCIAIFSTTRFPAEAWEFVRFLLRAEHDLMLASLCDQIPVRTDLLTNPIFAEYFNRNPVMVEFARQARRVRSMDAAPDMKEILDGLSQVYEACAVYGRFTPDEAAREVVRRTRMIVEWNR